MSAHEDGKDASDVQTHQQHNPNAATCKTYQAVMQQQTTLFAELSNSFPGRVHMAPLDKHALSLHTVIRNQDTSRTDFVFYADLLLRNLCEFALSHVPHVPRSVITPTEAEFHGLTFARPIFGVSILRAGESMENALRSVVREVRIGKILIQRDETDATKAPKLYYSKLPADLPKGDVLVLDPMCATGNSLLRAIPIILEAGVPEEQLIFVTLMASEFGLRNILNKYKKLQIVVGMIEPKLNERHFLIPGVGDFGDLYYSI